ncbi:PLDc N-terminal domain-containing protein [Herbiconiux sp. YIM B11900]|uniref:PLDc N-terminal domain-containing protein n=1 Tax=Herbiconiux sp. YIM B11900 TaxID=3404131 RepID=UPI003F82E2D5
MPFIGLAILAIGAVVVAQTSALTHDQKGAWVICVALLPLAGLLAWIIILVTH